MQLNRNAMTTLHRWRTFLGKHQLLTFYLLTFATTWAYTLPSALAQRGVFPPVATGLAALVAAPAFWSIVLTAIVDGREGLRRLLARIVQFRVSLRWYVFALASYSLMALFAVWFVGAAGLAQPMDWSAYLSGRLDNLAGHLGLHALPWYDLVVLVLAAFTITPLIEEVGWRGFAQVRLLARRHWAAAGAIVGALWAIWHLPLFFAPTSDQYGLPFSSFLIGVTALAVLMAWLMNRAAGSLVIPMLFHGSIIVASLFIPVLPSARPDRSAAAFWVTVVLGVMLAAAIVGYDYWHGRGRLERRQGRHDEREHDLPLDEPPGNRLRPAPEPGGALAR
jgi:uncharacterized protein